MYALQYQFGKRWITWSVFGCKGAAELEEMYLDLLCPTRVIKYRRAT